MSRPWMPLYVADYLADTMHLSTAQHGAYLLLIMHYWRAGSLPQDDETLARIVRATAAEWSSMRPTISALFDDGWRHKRIERELDEADTITTARRHAGLSSARKRRASNSTNDEQEPNKPPNKTPTNGQLSQPQPQSQDGMIDARARAKSSFTEGSKQLADAFWKALGFNNPIEIPPEFAGVDYRAVEWERAGWTVELVSSQAKRLALDQPLKPLTYFEKVFATAYAKQIAPLPVNKTPTNVQQTSYKNGSQYAAGNSIIQAADRLVDKLRAFEAGTEEATDDLCGGTSPPSVRIIPSG